MLKEYKSGPGRFEGLTPFYAWLADHADEIADESFGDVDGFGAYVWLVKAPHILPDRRRAFVIHTDSAGFHYVAEVKGPNAENSAGAFFDDWQASYDRWADESADE